MSQHREKAIQFLTGMSKNLSDLDLGSEPAADDRLVLAIISTLAAQAEATLELAEQQQNANNLLAGVIHRLDNQSQEQ